MGAAVAALALSGCGRGGAGEGKATAAARPVSVTTVAVAREDVQSRVSATGTVQAWQEVALSSQAGGLGVVEVRVAENDAVREGDVLVRLDDRSVRAQSAQQRAAVAEARANLETARSESARADALLAQRAMSAETAETRRTAVRTCQAKLDAAEAALAALAVTLDQATVRAPFPGTVSQAPVRVGAVPQVGTELVRIVRDGRHEVQARVPERALSAVRAGQSVTVTLPDGTAVPGKVRDVAAKVDAATRLGTVYVSLPAGAAARDGQSARVSLVTGAEVSLTVPERALVWDAGRPVAYVVGADGTARARRLSTGLRHGGRVTVASGLAAGDDVVVDGAGFLHDGEAVAAVPALAPVEEASR